MVEAVIPWQNFEQLTLYHAIHQPKLNAIQFYAKLIHLVWMYIFKLWASQNTHQATALDYFPPNMMLDMREYMQPETIYHHTPMTESITLLLNFNFSPIIVQIWILNNQSFIHNELKILAKQTCTNHSQDICQFFPPH